MQGMEPLTAPSGLESLRWRDRFVSELPGDPDSSNRPRQVLGACYSDVETAKVAAPETVAYSAEMAELLQLSSDDCESPEFAQVFAGNRALEGMHTYAMCYGGHQFGNWAGQLGDGRAINLGEVEAGDEQSWTLQLKGAGPTPYSRTADGLAVLRSSVREFLCSEAMHHLGVPTTRALSLVTTGEKVVRDMFYDGHPQEEPGAIVCRTSPSFIRFGNFEIFASRDEDDVLAQLADFTLRHHFPHLLDGRQRGTPEIYAAWLEEVCRRTAALMVDWTRVGFVHGVMNTDNMSILGQTIDYGPYGWLEDYDPGWTPNTTDAAGRRYRFGNQPKIAQWNLVMLANAIYPLAGDAELLQAALDAYADAYHAGWKEMMAGKLGLHSLDAADDQTLVNDLFDVLQLAETDMTIFFRALAHLQSEEAGHESETEEQRQRRLLEPLLDAFYVPEQLSSDVRARQAAWLERYLQRARDDGTPDAQRRERMNAVNPKFVLRNYLAQLAIDKAETGDPSLITELLDTLRRPYDEQPGREQFAEKRPEWARHRPGCSMLSCSS